MKRYKTLMIIFTMLMAFTFTGCGDQKQDADVKTADGVPSAETSEQSITTAAADAEENGTMQENAAADSSAEPGTASENITVVSKSDSTITQAEKKKVLDELSTEIDSLLKEVNKADASENAEL